MSATVGLLLTSIYVLGVIAVAERVRRFGNAEQWLTRKIIHIGVGMLIWVIPSLFSSAQPFIVIALIFTGVTLLDKRLGLFPAMASLDGSNWGTVYFPLVAALAAWWFWATPHWLVASLMPLVWGDGMAEVVGRRFGRKQYKFFNHARTLEGSLAFVACTFLATLIALTLLMPNPPTLVVLLVIAAVLSVATAAVEAVSVSGSDNVTVTVMAILLLTVADKML